MSAQEWEAVGAEIIEDDELRRSVSDALESRETSLGEFIENSIKTKFTVENACSTVGATFDGRDNFEDFIWKTIVREIADEDHLYTVWCGECSDRWLFYDKEEAEDFFETHEVHTRHEPTELSYL